MRYWKIRSALLFFSIVCIGGCRPDGDVGTIAVNQAAIPTSEPGQYEEIHTPTAVAQPPAPTIPETPLSTDGPWLVFTASDGIYAVNPDGSGPSHLLEVELADSYRSSLRTSKEGGLAAFVTQGVREYDRDLTIFSLPERRLVRTINLTQALPDLPEGPVFNDSAQAANALSYYSPFDISPDGSQVAFMGVIEGPSSDLYVYDLQSDTITRLTDGPAQGFDPHFSPDGEYIVHFSAASFGSGAGYSMDGVWAARADNGGVLSLYDPSGYGAEEFVGWVDDTTFLVNTWNADCGSVNLRAFNIVTGEVQIFWRHTFNDVAFDNANGTLAVAVEIDYEHCNPEGQFGVFLLPLDGSTPVQVFDEPTGFLAHHEADTDIILMTDFMSPAEVLHDGSLLSLNPSPVAYGYPVLSPDGFWAAWPGTALWIGRRDAAGELPPSLVLPQGIQTVVWSPDSRAVFLIADEEIFVAHTPEFSPIPVVEHLDLRRTSFAWILP